MGQEIGDPVEGLHFDIPEAKAHSTGPVLLHRGAIDRPDGYGRITGKCGDTIEIFLRFTNNRVKRASFETDGCLISAMCGSSAAELAWGKRPNELLEITGEAILEKVGELPKEEEHCANLVAETLQEALNDYMIKQTEQRHGKRLSNS